MKDKLERGEATGNSRNMIVPSVPSLRLVPVVPIRFSRSIAALRSSRYLENSRSRFNVNVESVKAVLGNKALHRGVEHHDVAYALREKSEAYNGDFGSKSEALSLETIILERKCRNCGT